MPPLAETGTVIGVATTPVIDEGAAIANEAFEALYDVPTMSALSKPSIWHRPVDGHDISVPPVTEPAANSSDTAGIDQLCPFQARTSPE